MDIEKVVPIINKISIFGGLTEKELCGLFRLLARVDYEADEIIFEQGDEPTHIYIVRSGLVKIIADIVNEPLELAAVEPGQCFGETALIGIQPHSASAVAVTRAELIVLTGDALLSLFEKDIRLFSKLTLNIAREACRRLHKTDQTMLHYVQMQNHPRK